MYLFTIQNLRKEGDMMRIVVILFTACAIVFFSAGLVRSDDMSELKEQIKTLQETINAQQKTIESLSTKIQSVESKQESQAKEVQKVPELAKKVGELKEKPAVKGLFEGVTVGGHLKFAMLDRTIGKRNGVDQHNNLGAGLFGSHNLYLLFSKEITDWLQMDVRTETDVSASATPSLGSDITRATSSSTSTSIDKAYLTALLPQGYELKVGKFPPMFSEDYAKETWWHQLYNMPDGECKLVSWHDFGAELYKNFDFDKWSLPVYLSLLNGNQSGSESNVDNNENKAVLVHIAPEFFQTKLKLLSSFGYGRWDDKGNNNMFRTNYGFEWKYQKFNLLGEYDYNIFDNLVVPATGTSPTADGKREGYWLRAIYTLDPKWRAVIQQSHYNMYKNGLTGQTAMMSDKWDTSDLALDYSLTPNSTIIGQYEKANAHRSDGSESLKFDRFTLGWRTTF